MIIKKKNDYLEHHGIKGMKWGIRRFQNKDGSLTELGKQRLSIDTYEREHDSDILLKREQKLLE